MKQISRYTVFGLMLMPTLVACSDLSVSDIDTSISVPVNNVTIPLKLDATKPLKLNSVIDLEGNDKIKEINGEYAVMVEGVINEKEYEAKTITIPAASFETNNVENQMHKMRPEDYEAYLAATGQKAARRHAAAVYDYNAALAFYGIPNLEALIDASTDEIDVAINYLNSLAIDPENPATFAYEVNLDSNNALMTYLSQFTMLNFRLQVPAGFEGEVKIKSGGTELATASITPDGFVDFSTYELIVIGGKFNIEATITSINGELLNRIFGTTASDAPVRAPQLKAGNKSEVHLSEKIGVTGEIWVSENDFKDEMKDKSSDEKFASLSSEVEVESSGSMSDIVITSVSGDFTQSVDDIAINGITLDNLPSFLSKDGTNIILSQPQIYLRLWNSASDFNVSAEANLSISTFDASGNQLNVIDGQLIKANSYDNLFCLSPDESVVDELFAKNHYTDYDFNSGKIEYVKYDGLGKILEGNHIPEKIDITASNIVVGGPDVKDLALGRSYSIKGDYVFYAPLALGEGSIIQYEDYVDGWSGDTEKYDIKELKVTTTVNSNLPVDLSLSIIPIKADGSEIVTTENSPVIILANKDGQEVTVVIKGDIKNLDGVKYVASATAPMGGGSALRPDMGVTIGNLKVSVSGSYND